MASSPRCCCFDLLRPRAFRLFLFSIALLLLAFVYFSFIPALQNGKLEFGGINKKIPASKGKSGKISTPAPSTAVALPPSDHSACFWLYEGFYLDWLLHMRLSVYHFSHQITPETCENIFDSTVTEENLQALSGYCTEKKLAGLFNDSSLIASVDRGIRRRFAFTTKHQKTRRHFPSMKYLHHISPLKAEIPCSIFVHMKIPNHYSKTENGPFFLHQSPFLPEAQTKILQENIQHYYSPEIFQRVEKFKGTGEITPNSRISSCLAYFLRSSPLERINHFISLAGKYPEIPLAAFENPFSIQNSTDLIDRLQFQYQLPERIDEKTFDPVERESRREILRLLVTGADSWVNQLKSSAIEYSRRPLPENSLGKSRISVKAAVKGFFPKPSLFIITVMTKIGNSSSSGACDHLKSLMVTGTPIYVLGFGESIKNGEKINILHRFLLLHSNLHKKFPPGEFPRNSFHARLDNSSALLFVDGFDIIFQWSDEMILNEFLSTGMDLLFSAELWMWPNAKSPYGLGMEAYSEGLSIATKTISIKFPTGSSYVERIDSGRRIKKVSDHYIKDFTNGNFTQLAYGNFFSRYAPTGSGTGFFNYLNSGAYIGYFSAVLGILEASRKCFTEDFIAVFPPGDQFLCSQIFLSKRLPISIDKSGSLFHSMFNMNPRDAFSFRTIPEFQQIDNLFRISPPNKRELLNFPRKFSPNGGDSPSKPPKALKAVENSRRFWVSRHTHRIPAIIHANSAWAKQLYREKMKKFFWFNNGRDHRVPDRDSQPPIFLFNGRGEFLKRVVYSDVCPELTPEPKTTTRSETTTKKASKGKS